MMKAELRKLKAKFALKWSLIFMVLLYIPILQILPGLVAAPLFFIKEIGQSSKYMKYTFAYTFPKHEASILMFFVYFLVVTYLYSGMIFVDSDKKSEF